MQQHRDFVTFKIRREDYTKNKYAVKVLHNSIGVQINLSSVYLALEEDEYGYINVVCTPEEFTNFIIERSASGMPNLIKDLDIDIVPYKQYRKRRGWLQSVGVTNETAR